MKRYILFAILFASIFALSVEAQTKFTFEGKIISENANLRSEPNTSSKVIRVLEKDTTIFTASLESESGWYYVSANKTKGWLHGNTFEFDLLPSEIYNPEVPAGWYLIAQTANNDTGYKYYYLLSSVKRNNSELEKYGVVPSIELWTRTVPFNAQKYAKKLKLPKGFAYSLEYVSISCKEKRLSVESITLYDSNNEILPNNRFSLGMYREPIVPNSIGESIWKKFCLD